MNPRREPSIEVPNDPDWGLATVEVPLRKAEPAEPIECEWVAGPGSGISEVLAEVGRQSVLTAARVGRRLVKVLLTTPGGGA